MMEDFELTLFDRINVIRDTINKYGEDNFYIAFSGGKDSTVLHYLVDMAIPNNKIPRVYVNTGIEYTSVVNFVKDMAEKDERFKIVKPSVNIKQMLEKYGYPLKSKEHSLKISQYKNGSRAKYVMLYKDGYDGVDNSRFQCPKILKYQYDDNFTLNISDKCCYKLKKEPFKKWQKENGKTITMTGLRKGEGGQRANIINCIITKNGSIVKFHPLLVVSANFENWFIDKYKIKLCELYYKPFNFERTGCKGCPYSLNLQEQLEVMEQLLPNEYKQCESIWKPVYDEYRRIEYRLKKEYQTKLILDEVKDEK